MVRKRLLLNSGCSSPKLVFRRARSLICYWIGSQLVFCNYCARSTITATPLAVLLITLLNDWRSPAELSALLPKFTQQDIHASLKRLVRHGVLIEKGTAAAILDEQLHQAWSSWLPHAAFFHFGTKDVPYESRPKQLLRMERGLFETAPQPPFFKNYPRQTKVRLSRPAREPGLPQILLARRTRREFSQKQIPLDRFSKLLFYSWGVTGFLQSSVFGPLPLKTSPSSGARHPIETYVLIMRVEKIKPGLYHYNSRLHCLERIRGLANPAATAAQFCAQQGWARRAAALFIMTAVFPRSMWKYPTARAYRTVLLDAGHVSQTFCLAATWLGLASVSTMALRDSFIEEKLQIDGITESVLYIVGAGMPEGDLTEDKRRNLAFASL